MKKSFSFIITFLLMSSAQTQNVGIGTITPAAKLTVNGTGNNASIPGNISTGIFRIGVANNEGIDIGKMSLPPYSGWIQSGYNSVTADPLCLQPSGGIVGIGTSAPQAALDVSSSTQGFLPPRMTIAQRDGITNPVAGLVIYNSECDEIELYNGTIWKKITGAAACSESAPLSVIICSQEWMIKNLDVSNYKNGDPIPEVTDPTAWAALTTGAWCWFNNDPAIGAIYGKLYNYYAFTDPRGLAPAGWHVSTDAEWLTLSTCLGGNTISGGKMKETGTLHWNSPNNGATNSSGFTALPGSSRFSDGTFSAGGVGGNAWWWASGLHGYNINNLSPGIGRVTNTSNVGYSVRCVRD